MKPPIGSDIRYLLMALGIRGKPALNLAGVAPYDTPCRASEGKPSKGQDASATRDRHKNQGI
jgi:hypothetical protein